MSAPSLTLDGLRARFARDPDCLVEIAEDIAARFATSGPGHIQASLEEAAHDLLARCPEPSDLPLWGVLYVVAANIDVVGLPTSIGVPALDFQPDFDAVVVERLRAAGALLVGKVPVDALGLGGAANGVAASVAAGMAAFGIASDWGAASAAASHGVVAIEPTRGLIPTEGFFAIAPELESIAIFAGDVESGTMVRCVTERTAEIDARPTRLPLSLGVVEKGWPVAAHQVADRLGLAAVSVDDAPFAELAGLLDDDIWLALRFDDVAPIFMELPGLFPPCLRGHLARAFGAPVSAQLRAQRHLSNLCQRIEAVFSGFDLLFMPPGTNLTGFAGVCGLPSITLPDGGALVGPGGGDHLLDGLARAFVTPDHKVFTRPIDILASSPLAHR